MNRPKSDIVKNEMTRDNVARLGRVILLSLTTDRVIGFRRSLAVTLCPRVLVEFSKLSSDVRIVRDMQPDPNSISALVQHEIFLLDIFLAIVLVLTG